LGAWSGREVHFSQGWVKTKGKPLFMPFKKGNSMKRGAASHTCIKFAVFLTKHVFIESEVNWVKK
jgi:hypothetical protein